ncbi:hypothetical protein [Paraburkholderia unamae]|uniref:Uncharacterized protein n=1 Tax=Paraburkholderia unamae TaxID=219649 RepID=A0ABX5K9W2_9BURK|nr:hypothetical protein [Paraburkholderia unamae]PVX61281.1 hypothetical protein C7402_14274 [Paraburkholderia unamae]
MNKEQIYDAQISPLMGKIIEICRLNKIAFVASFAIPNEEDNNLCCSSAMLGDEFEPPVEFKRAWNEIKPGGSRPMMLRTEDGDGRVTLTAIV